MQLAAKTQYAAIAMLELAARFEARQPVRIRDIAAAHSVPSRFLVQILLQLKNAGLVTSTRGASGGYQLAIAPEEITLADVAAAIEGGPDEVSNCAGDTPTCRVLQSAWQSAADAHREALEAATLAELVEQAQQQSSEMYYI